MKHEFDREDVTKHCLNNRFCQPHASLHVVAFPAVFKGFLPWPDSLHVRVETAACGCSCEDCVTLREKHNQEVTSSVLVAYEAYKGGKPAYDPKCPQCVRNKNNPPKPKERA